MRGRAVEDTADAVERHLQRIGSNLREDRLDPLPDTRRADIDRDRAVGLQHHAGVLARAGRTALDVATHRQAVVTAVDQLALQRGLLAPADLGQAAVERDAVVAGVGFGRDIERHHGGERIGHLRFRDQVAAPEFDAVEAEVARRHVEQTLAKEIGLEPPRPSIGADRRLVADMHRHIDADIRNAVGARQHLRDIARAGRAVGAQIGADVGMGVTAQRPDRAVAIAGDLKLALDVAGVIGRNQMFPAILDPFHRPADGLGCERNQEILGIELAADAERAADVALDHGDGIFRQRQLRREDAADGEGDLGGAVDRQDGRAMHPSRRAAHAPPSAPRYDAAPGTARAGHRARP